LERPLQLALEATEAARSILLAECARPDGPRGKIGRCPADDEAEWAIRRILLDASPGWGYLGEETAACTADEGVDCVWIVDPNDGTSTMQRGYRGHAISIALVRDGVPVLGVVCAVDAPDDSGDLIAWAENCGPLRRNGVELSPPSFAAQLARHDIVGLSQGANRNPIGYLACIAPARFISTPSIAYRLALVAVGEHVATLSLNHLSAWDFAAGHALLRAVGGVVLDEAGREIVYPSVGAGTRSRVFAGGRAIVEELLKRPWDSAPGSGFGEAAPPPERYPVRAVPGRLAHTPGQLSRAQGCLLGQLAGDAQGGGLVEGQPSGASELALCLARSLVLDGGFDDERVASAYAAWYRGWTHSESPEECTHVWCRPIDVGSTIAQALGAVSPADVTNGQAATRARSVANRQSQSNGALMRVSPLGIWGALRESAVLAEAARADAALTHPHAVCQDASAVFAVALAAAVRDGLSAADTHALALRQASQPIVRAALQAAADSPPADYRAQRGWLLIALQNAFFQLLHASSFEEGIVATIRAGGDTDTNAAICGALLGAVHGRAAIPDQWQQMVLSCRPMPGQPGIQQPRPALFWPTDALILAERLLMSGASHS
jgi:fructose-1,6-bisphosphatase/inositol monophosphatase family enzyme/ADP-ribosylglycohydrolase